MRRVKTLLVLWSFLLACSGRAAEATATKADPTGTWKWSAAVAASKTAEAQIKLLLREGKLTGVAIGPDKKELPLEKVEFKDGRIRFEVTRTVQGRKFATRYEGTITGDRIAGKASNSASPSARSVPWEAVRARDEVPPPQADRAPSQSAPASIGP